MERGRNRTGVMTAWEINSGGLIVNLARLSALCWRPADSGLVQHGAGNQVKMVFEGVIPTESSSCFLNYPLLIKFSSTVLHSSGMQ